MPVAIKILQYMDMNADRRKKDEPIGMQPAVSCFHVSGNFRNCNPMIPDDFIASGAIILILNLREGVDD